MKKFKMITITLLLLMTFSIMRPYPVFADEELVKLESCEKETLIKIFNNYSYEGKINADYNTVLVEHYNQRCKCSYYTCPTYGGEEEFIPESLTAFANFSQALISYINDKEEASLLKEPSSNNKSLTKFEKLLNACFVNDPDNISKYYECAVYNNCNTTTPGDSPIGSDVESCTGLIGQDAADLINEILDWIRILGPLALIIYSALDLAVAVAGKYEGNEDALATAKLKIKKRVIACLILIFIPTILQIIFNAIKGAIVFSTDCVLIIKNMFLWR